MPLEAFLRVAEFSLKLRGPLTALVGGSPRKRVHGMRLVANDVDWTHGEGPQVHGTSESLLLLLAGRQLAHDDLSGPRASVLYERLAAPGPDS